MKKILLTVLQCLWAIFDLDDPSSTPKMVENGPKRSKMTFFNTPIKPIKPDVHLTHLTHPGLTHLTHPRV